MSKITSTNTLTPWAESLPSEWGKCRLDAVADVLFSNVDKHTREHEISVRLCNYVDVYFILLPKAIRSSYSLVQSLKAKI